jgi:hypothetical protein
MTRQIVTKPKTGPAAGAEVGQMDTLPQQIIKLIPAEAVTLFVTLDNALAATVGSDPPDVSTGTAKIIFLVLVLVGTVGTPLYLLKQEVKSAMQLVLSTVAFLIWAFATTKSFSLIFVPIPLIFAAVAVGLFTFVVPPLMPKQ